MGKAIIVEDKGLGLYGVKLDYNLTAVNGEIAALETQETEYWGKLLKALNTLDDLRRAKWEAADGANEVIQQWKDLLIDKMNEEPPAIPPPEPNDPETGEPWEDNDRAQDGPLFTAINAERTAEGLDALTRNDVLDTSILRHLRFVAATGRTTHYDATGDAASRAGRLNYDYDDTIGVGQCQAFGTRTPEATVALWMKRSSDRTLLLNEDYTECGVAYVYAPKNPYTYLWGVVLATPGPPPPEPAEDPAQESAEEADAALDKIELPTIETFEPDKLGAVAAELAKAALRVTAAEKAVQILMAERIERLQRLVALEAVADREDEIIDAWACMPPDILAPGASVMTAEIPGYYLREGVNVTRTVTVEIGQPSSEVSYTERPINLIPPTWTHGQLNPTVGVSSAEAFFHAAIEPGAVRWRPLWRYGTIMAITGDVCSLTLETRTVRQFRSDAAELVLDTPAQRTLTNVPISYPPCNGEVFVVGDDVLVLFEGQDRDAPKVVGFKYAPRICPQGRSSWRQLIRA